MKRKIRHITLLAIPIVLTLLATAALIVMVFLGEGEEHPVIMKKVPEAVSLPIKESPGGVMEEGSASNASKWIVTQPQTVAETQPQKEPSMDEGPFETSVFDKIPDEKFSGLDPIQQTLFVHAEEKFNAFYREWSDSGRTNPEEWNNKVREFQQEMLLDLGPDLMDRLLRSHQELTSDQVVAPQ